MGDPNQMQLPREFRMSGSFGRVVRSYAFVLVSFFALVLVVSASFAGWWGGIAIAAAAVGAVVARVFSKFRAMRTGTVVRFSEQGVELSDQVGFRVRLLWPDIVRIGEVETRLSAPPRNRRLFRDVQVRDGVLTAPGVVGWGERITPPNLPDWMRERLASVPVNPADGRREVTIPLGEIDPNWVRGPMGEWVRRYRPDLFGRQPYST